MNLKQLLQDDLSIFFNQNEFSDIHLINNVAVNSVLTDFTTNLNNQNLNVYDKELGVKTSDLNLFPTNLSVESIITVDGTSYKISKISECEGLTTIKLTSHLDNLGLTIAVKYRNRAGLGANQDLGIPGTKTAWSSASSLSYTYFDKITNNFEQKDTGLILAGDIQIRVLTASYNVVDLINYEYLINNQVYGIINNKIISNTQWHTLFLRLLND